MPSRARPGKKALYVELPDQLDGELRTYCDRRGVRIADEVRLAIRRHLANPPPVDVPPLPPLTVEPLKRAGTRRGTK
jgi:hypothetical protein